MVLACLKVKMLFHGNYCPLADSKFYMRYEITNRFEHLTKMKKAGPIALLVCLEVFGVVAFKC